MKKKHIIIICCVVLLILIAGIFTWFSHQNDTEATTVPKEVSETLENYLSALKEGVDKAVEYAHFEDDFTREAFIDSGSYLIDYEIEDAEKVNENLYAFSILSKTNTSVLYQGDEPIRVYNFVGKVNGDWYFMNGVAQVPEDIQENFDPSKYSYSDDNIVDRDDVLVTQ